MSRYIDADTFDDTVQMLNERGWHITNIDYKRMDRVLFEMPTAYVVEKEKWDRLLENSIILAEAAQKYQLADVVEVVRCKDCVYWEQATDNSGNCNRAFEITAYGSDYCSYGERREDDKSKSNRIS